MSQSTDSSTASNSTMRSEPTRVVYPTSQSTVSSIESFENEYPYDIAKETHPPRSKKSIIFDRIAMILVGITIGLGLSVAVVLGGRSRDRTNESSGLADDLTGEVMAPTLFPTTEPTTKPTTEPMTRPTTRPTTEPTTRPTATRPTNTASSLAFYVLGEQEDMTILEEQLMYMTENLHPKALFTLHVGDLGTDCSEQKFDNARKTLENGPLSTFVLPGDDDIINCPDSDMAWSYYDENFVFPPFENEWTSLPNDMPVLNVTRWTRLMNIFRDKAQARLTIRPELFSFVRDGILFLSLTLLVGDENSEDFESTAWDARLNESTVWASRQLKQALWEHEIRGVVMFGHAQLSSPLEPFFLNLHKMFEAYNYYGPTLYVHGDGSKFQVENPFSGTWDSFTDIQISQADNTDPLLFRVVPMDTVNASVADNDDQSVVGNGLFLIDRL